MAQVHNGIRVLRGSEIRHAQVEIGAAKLRINPDRTRPGVDCFSCLILLAEGNAKVSPCSCIAGLNGNCLLPGALGGPPVTAPLIVLSEFVKLPQFSVVVIL